MKSKPLTKAGKASEPAVIGKKNKVAKRVAKEGDNEAYVDPIEAFKDFELEQAQNRRWLDLQRPGLNPSANLTQQKYIELLDYFSYFTPEQRERLGKLSAECKEVVARLENERTRSLAIQGGVGRPRDWFVSKDEEKDLISQLNQAAIGETPKERTARVQNRNQRKKQQKKFGKVLDIMSQLGVEKDEAESLLQQQAVEKKQKYDQGRPKSDRPENTRQRKFREFLEKKERERVEREAAADGEGSLQATKIQSGERMDVDEETVEAL